MRRHSFIQAPTLTQLCCVFNLIRKGREIVSSGELAPADAVDLRNIINMTEREFELSVGDDNGANGPEYERDLSVLRDLLPSRP